MLPVIISFAGHIDHGKSSLLNAINPFTADRRLEEKKRSITINLGFNYETIDNFDFFYIDMPGHSDYLPNMLKGIVNADIAILTIDALEGIKEQTLEHLFIISKSKCQIVIFTITKYDKVDKTRIYELSNIIKILAEKYQLSSYKITETSIIHTASIDNLKQILLQSAQNIKPKTNHFRSRLFIDRAFIIDGAGVVITGIIDNGKITVKDKLKLFPSMQDVKVKAIQVANHVKTLAEINERAAINIADIKITDAKKQQILFDDKLYELHKKYNVELHINPDTNTNIEIKPNKKYNLIIGSINITAIIIPDQAVIIFDNYLPLIAGDILYLRAGAVPKTIAAIKITSPFIKKQRIKIKPAIVVNQPNNDIFIEADNILSQINLSKKITSLLDIKHQQQISEKLILKAVNHLTNNAKIIKLAEGRFLSCEAFETYFHLVKNAVESGASVDIKLFRDLTKLSRDASIMLLDKLDTLRDLNGKQFWKIEKMKRGKLTD